MRKESAIIRKCSAQRTGEPFHYASIQHILLALLHIVYSITHLLKGSCSLLTEIILHDKQKQNSACLTVQKINSL